MSRYCDVACSATISKHTPTRRNEMSTSPVHPIFIFILNNAPHCFSPTTHNNITIVSVITSTDFFFLKTAPLANDKEWSFYGILKGALKGNSFRCVVERQTQHLLLKHLTASAYKQSRRYVECQMNGSAIILRCN